MPSFDYKGALQAGYSPEEIDSYLKMQQNTSPARYPLMGLSEGLAGLEQLEELPAAGLNWLRSQFAPKLPAIAGVTPLTNAAGITNQTSLQPNNLGERLFAAAARGAGAAAPTMLMGPEIGGPAMVLSALGSVAGQGVKEMLPEAPGWLPALAGMATGALGGGIGGVVRSLTSPSSQATVDRTIADLGGTPYSPGAGNATTLTQAGSEIQREMKAQSLLGATGLGPGLKMDAADIKKYTSMRPDRAANALANDPVNLPILRDAMPDQVDQLGAARLNLNAGRYWNSAPQEVKEALAPDHWQQLDAALAKHTSDNRSAAARIGEPLTASIAGGLVGGLTLPHLIPGIGEYVGGEIGSGVALALDMASRHAARSILDPWVLGMTGAGTMGGAVGPTQPVNTLAAPP